MSKIFEIIFTNDQTELCSALIPKGFQMGFPHERSAFVTNEVIKYLKSVFHTQNF